MPLVALYLWAPLKTICSAVYVLQRIDQHHYMCLHPHIRCLYFDSMAMDTISPADRIRELSAINADVATMLASAGSAVNALTNRPLTTQSQSDEDTHMTDSRGAVNLEERQEAFQQNASDYYTNLQGIIARLRRQAYALEEAGIITPEANALTTLNVRTAPTSRSGAPGRGPAAAAPESERITNGGLGNQDIGWLNSRGNRVGAEKERELVLDAKKLVEDVLAQDDEG